ncbi:hypothetical protein [Tuwongella immobilis]|nr:hypothetical protein [Tuwongella immobilis]
MLRWISLPVLAVMGVVFAAPNALAWKPKTHVYLAEEAMKDALDDGRITLYAVDPATNRLKRGANGNLVPIGNYRVDPRILEALAKYPDQFRAGVLGPDAFPDILTGQQIIHPAGQITRGETGVDLNKNGPGPDAWLRHLWAVAYTERGQDSTPATRAFVSGFLAHAAGDMFGHTCVNYYTGDAFHFQPRPENAARHIIIEGYFDKRVPAPTYKTSIGDGVDGFIYRQMILGRPNTRVEALLRGENVSRTLAARFSNLRNRLQDDVERGRFFNPVTQYKKSWIKDIDRGLEKLPGFSHELALALMFNPTGKADTAKAKKIVESYQQTLMSMAGLPDATGPTLAFFKAAVKALGLEALETFIKQIEKEALDYLVKSATGLTVSEFEKLLLAESTDFDRWMDQPPLPNGTRTTRSEFEANELKLMAPGGWIDYRHVPPAYNTVLMIKLSFLGRDELNRLMADLGAPASARLTEENVMLGFLETLDGSNQWWINDKKMAIARHPAGFARVFLKQNGDRRPVGP